MIAGYEIDPVARIDIVAELRYQWFDWILKGGPKPALLADKVNYEVMGANRWKHAPSIAAMANGALRFYLSAERSGAGYRLTASVRRRASLGDADGRPRRPRRTASRIVPGGGVVDTAIDTAQRAGVRQRSAPRARPR